METPNPQEKPLEFLKREDVRTMAKDMALLREGEAKVEAAKIGEFRPPQQPLPQQPLTIPQEPLKVALTPIASEVEHQPLMGVKRQGLGKLFIRVLLVAVLLFVIFNALALAYWLSQKEKGAGPEPSPSPEPSPAIQPLTTPEPVFPFTSTEQIPLQKNEGLALNLEQAFLKPRTFEFTRIVPANIQENRVWNLKEFFLGLSVGAPEEITNSLEENFTLFLHKNSQGTHRMGFAVPVLHGKDIQAALTSWEPTLEKDLALLFSFQGQKDSFYVPFFRETLYKEVRVRFQTFSAQDLGLVYAVVNNTLVVASSLESMNATIDEIKE